MRAQGNVLRMETCLPLASGYRVTELSRAFHVALQHQATAVVRLTSRLIETSSAEHCRIEQSIMANTSAPAIEVKPPEVELSRPTTASTERIVDFDNPGDPADPHNWSYIYRWTLVVLFYMMTLIM